MHIKKLEIYGFKSFGLKNTSLNFGKGLVAVTGPNGSGKSNIMDAILFAMGENSPKAMRVDRFQSLFHDNQSTSSGLIRVSLSFDNTDRGIPVDFDSVTLTREMEGRTGDSQYYLNGKKVTKFTITELLEIVMGASNKLNIVQQGMITRISELNLDERRKIIEDIVGLSYFDEKKTEAVKHLEEADRRLEVAFAKIGEIRKRIDELEAERNDQLRYGHLEKEITKFKAVKLSNTLRSIRDRTEARKKVLDSTKVHISELSLKLEEVQSKIEKINTEKIRFIQDVDAANKVKAKIGSRLASIVYEAERKKALLKETEQRINYLDKRIPLLKTEKHSYDEKIVKGKSDLHQINLVMNDKRESLSKLRSELEKVNSKIDEITSMANAVRDSTSKLESKYKKLQNIKNNIEVSRTRIEEKTRLNQERGKEYIEKISLLAERIQKDKTSLNICVEVRDSEMANLDSMFTLQKDLEKLEISYEDGLSKSGEVLSRAKNTTSRYEAKTTIAKDVMNEDFAAAELMPKYDQFGIKGLVHEVLNWDRAYERAVLAAGSDWMKAFVVDSVRSMISIVQYAKSRQLPRLRIIPLSVLNHTQKNIISKKDRRDITGIIGNLSDFIKSDYSKLVRFIFGSTFLVRTPSLAYLLAKRGYRVVSISGELFESDVTSMSVDFGSKISDLTEAILLGDSIGIMRRQLTSLDDLIRKKTIDHDSIASKLRELEPSVIRGEAKIGNVNNELAYLQNSVADTEASLSQLNANYGIILSENNQLTYELEKYQTRLAILTSTMDRITQQLKINEDSVYKNELVEVGSRKTQIIKLIENFDFELRELITSSTSSKIDLDNYVERANSGDEEMRQLESEVHEKNGQLLGLRNIVQSVESEIQTCRDQEQQTIDASGASYTILQEYEAQIRLLMEDEKKLSKEINALERDFVVNQKDVSNLNNEELEHYNELNDLGYKNLLDSFDVDVAIKELNIEYEKIRNTINLRAVESYGQVVDGYRGMSTRRNELETERNSIISFIEETVKEKKEVFMDAFTKVDDNIRKTFSEITGGSARLELEDADDISSGILLMVQFPGKNARESTSLSGGEKTMAATIFLLALQSLRPSPFYIMDEVDAHLDAENTDRLSKVLVQRSKDSQIIMVTLKDSIVAEASLVYGVYPKGGVSQVIKYNQQNKLPITEIRSNITKA
ncbi:MAG: chromosome segregation SMC family protein [Nitrososphaeraceae archaeon]